MLEDNVPSLDIEKQIMPAPNLKYFNGFSKKELESLLEKYHQANITDLEKMIHDHRHYYWFNRLNNAFCVVISNGFYLLYPIINSRSAISTIANIFSPNVDVPATVGYSIGIPLSTVEVLFYALLFSPNKEALKDTLDYASKPTVAIRWQNFISNIPIRKRQALQNFALDIFNESLLMICNLNGAASEVIYLPLSFSQPLGIFCLIVALYTGRSYFANYINAEYRSGLKFWHNEKKLPWFFQQMRDGEWAIPLQIALQGLSAVGLRTFFVYYFIAISASAALGWWFNPLLIAALAFIQGLCTYYPTAYLNYMDSRLKIIANFTSSQAIDDIILNDSSLTVRPMTLEHLTSLQHQYAFKKYKEARSHVFSEIGQIALLKSIPSTDFRILIRAILGAYFAYTIADYLQDDIQKKIIMGLLIQLITVLFSTPLYAAEMYRLADQKILEKFSPPVELAPESNRLKFTAGFINLGGAMIGAMSSIGTIVPVIGQGQKSLITIFTILTFEQMMVNITFNGEKVKETVKDLGHSLKSWQLNRMSFFKKKNPALLVTDVMPNTSPQLK